MLQGEHSARLLAFITQPFSIKTFVLSIFKWPLKTGFTVLCVLELIPPLGAMGWSVNMTFPGKYSLVFLYCKMVKLKL